MTQTPPPLSRAERVHLYEYRRARRLPEMIAATERKLEGLRREAKRLGVGEVSPE